MTTFHLVFGTGPLGLATARALIARGHAVHLVNRRGVLHDLPVGARIVAADLSDGPAIRRAADGAAAIYFCVQPPYHLWPTEFPPLQDHAIRLAADIGARLVVAENLYGYGPVDGQAGSVDRDRSPRAIRSIVPSYLADVGRSRMEQKSSIAIRH